METKMSRRKFAGTAIVGGLSTLAAGTVLGAPLAGLAARLGNGSEIARRIGDSSTFRFAILGDTHVTRPEWHPNLKERGPAGQHDVDKYVANVEQYLRPVLRAIASSGAQFLVHSGDLVEGTGVPASFREEEMRYALEVMSAAQIPCVFARGNHDAKNPFAAVVRPANASTLGMTLDSDNFWFDAGNARFVFVDWQSVKPGEPSARWLEETLQAARARPHVFVVAHSPVWNIGRPFMRDLGLAQTLPSLAGRFGIDALICGHTHNQAITLHRTEGRPLLQVMTTAIGWGEQRFLPLDQVKTWLPPRDSLNWNWPGYLENSAPGWCLVEVEGPQATLRWRDFANEDHVVIRWRKRGAVKEIARRKTPVPARPTADDLRRARRGWLCLSLFAAGQAAKEVRLGDMVLGEFPATVPHYHHRTELSPQALRQLSLTNRVRIAAPDEDAFCVGSLMLEVELADGRVVRTQPVPQIYSTAEKFDSWREAKVRRAARAADLPEIELTFAR